MSHRSYTSERRAHHEVRDWFRKAAREVQSEFLFIVLTPMAKCQKPDCHQLLVACAEAEFVRGFFDDRVLDDWYGWHSDELGQGVQHVMACGCVIVSVPR